MASHAGECSVSTASCFFAATWPETGVYRQFDPARQQQPLFGLQSVAPDIRSSGQGGAADPVIYWIMVNSMSLSVVKELFAHNYWARDRQLQACAALTPEQFLCPLGNSFPSIRDTLVHLLAVEWLWLERWRGRSPRVLLAPQEFPTLASVCERWAAVEQEMVDYLGMLREAALEESMTCVGTRGNTWTYSLWRMMIHLLEHQAYHRGQVTSLLRQLGLEPPKADFLDGQDAGLSLHKTA